MMPCMNALAAKSVRAAIEAAYNGGSPRQKSNGFGNFSNHTSSGRKTWLASGVFGPKPV